VALKRRAKKEKQAKVGLTPADWRYPNERGIYWQAIIGVFIVCIVAAAVAFMIVHSGNKDNNPLHGLYQIPALILVWPIVSVLAVNWICARPWKKRLKTLGPQAKVSAANRPELRRVILDITGMFGMAEPDTYVVEEETPQIEVIAGGKGTVILSTGLLKAFEGSQLKAALAHELAHLKCGHVRIITALLWIDSAKLWAKALLLPGLLLGRMLGAWLDVVDYSADRAAILATGSVADVNATMLKRAVLTDPLSQIEADELDEYLHETGELGTDSVQVERHFKIGNFVASVHNLRERINETAAYLNTEQGKQAVQKLAEMRRGAPAAGGGNTS